jgi:cysteinyl-tRNA synthetase
MLLLQTHYRSPVRVGQDNIDAAVKALAGVDAFFGRIDTDGVSARADVIDAFRAAMDNDLDTPAATALMFDTMRRANAAADAGNSIEAAELAAAVREICAAFGLPINDLGDVDADAAGKAAELDAARAAKDFARADTLRAELQAAGYVVETTKDGTRVRRG